MYHDIATPDQHVLVLRSVIYSSLLNNTLYTGAKTALAGILIIYISYFQIVQSTTVWGYIIWWIGTIMIGVGVYPYKKLSRLQITPYVLEVNHTTLKLIRENRIECSLHISDIASVTYKNEQMKYGIVLHLKKDRALTKPTNSSQISLYAKIINTLRHEEKSRALSTAVIFIPYFTEKASIKLQEYLHELRN